MVNPTRDLLWQDLQDPNPTVRAAAVEHPRAARHHVALGLTDSDALVRAAADRVARERFWDLLTDYTGERRRGQRGSTVTRPRPRPN